MINVAPKKCATKILHADRCYFGNQSCQVELVEFRDSVGGGVVAEFFRALQKPTRFSGRGVVAEFFRHLKFAKSIFYPTLTDIPG